MHTRPRKLWIRYHRATPNQAIIKTAFLSQTGHIMAAESTTRKDTLRVEKLSLLVLALCVVVLVYLLVRPF
jgi:hypothetical protein